MRKRHRKDEAVRDGEAAVRKQNNYQGELRKMEKLLEIKNFKLDFNGPYGIVPAVRGVDLSVGKGETLALVGESGCGKTSLCRSILRLHSSHALIGSGSSVILCGSDISKFSDSEMEAVRGSMASMVFQDPAVSLDPVYSIGRQVMEPLTSHGWSADSAKTRALELLAMVGIDRAEMRFAQYPHEFSGGMKQRAALAIALAGDPSLLILDEPTTSLDPATQDKIIELIKKLIKGSERAALFVTHDLGLAEDLADRVAVMKDGVIVENGYVDQVFQAPVHEYTEKLLGYVDYGKGKGHRHRTGKTPPAAVAGRCESTLVSVDRAVKSYALGRHRAHKVLDGISMKISDGEILGIIGDSGCGKTTLAKCITGIEKLDSGDISFQRKCTTQMIFQDSASALDPHMRIRDIIAEPLRIRSPFMRRAEIYSRVDEVMEQTELDKSLADRFPYDISGGQRQRAAIARTLITDPDFIIADEPISSLDVSIQAQIIHMLRDIHDRRGLTMMIIGHDLPMIDHISDRVISL